MRLPPIASVLLAASAAAAVLAAGLAPVPSAATASVAPPGSSSAAEPAVSLASPTATSAVPPELSVATTVETFHHSPTHLCAERVNIDGPVRAFEDQHHVIHLLTATPRGRAYQWTGSAPSFAASPRTATLDCDPVMLSFGEDDPLSTNEFDKFDQKTFVQALFFDSPTVYGYGHEDYYATRLVPIPTGCDDHTNPDDKGHVCWYSAVAAWKAEVPASGDRHLTFGRVAPAPNQIAIYPRIQYPGHENTPYAGWIGYGAPSNIVRGRANGALDGYYYIFVYTSAGDTGQPKGVCLFRTQTPQLRDSWRGWNGTGFTLQSVNPYVGTNTACTVVAPSMFQQPVRSVVFHKPSGHYLAFYRAGDGVRYSTSTNLLTWSPSKLLLAGTTDQVNYQSVIDFTGGDHGDDNFDRLYDADAAYLFYRQTEPGGHSSLLRRKLDVTNYGPDAPGVG